MGSLDFFFFLSFVFFFCERLPGVCFFGHWNTAKLALLYRSSRLSIHCSADFFFMAVTGVITGG